MGFLKINKCISDGNENILDTAKPVVKQGRKAAGLLHETAKLLGSFVAFVSSINTKVKNYYEKV